MDQCARVGLRQLADELRAETIDAVSQTGGHLGAGLGVALQVALGAPFLLTYPTSYISRAFEFTRVSRVCVVCLLVRENPSLPRALW